MFFFLRIFSSEITDLGRFLDHFFDNEFILIGFKRKIDLIAFIESIKSKLHKGFIRIAFIIGAGPHSSVSINSLRFGKTNRKRKADSGT